jgi:hypothetical protein
VEVTVAKPKGVVRLRHPKEPHLEVHVYQDQETKEVTVTLLDWERARVLSWAEGEGKRTGAGRASPRPPRPGS